MEKGALRANHRLLKRARFLIMAGLSNITIGFSTTNLLISRIIRKSTGSPVSHAWWAFDDEALGVRLVMQAEAWGVELRPWDNWQRKNQLKAEFYLTGPDPENSVKWGVKNYVGVPYDWRSAFLSGFWRWFGRWLKNKRSTPGQTMCSEVTVRILQHAAYSSIEHFNPEVTNPLRLLERVLEMSLKFHEQFAIKMLHNDIIPLAAKFMTA